MDTGNIFTLSDYMSSFAAISADGRMLSISQKIIAIGKVYITSHGFFPVGKSDSLLQGVGVARRY